MQKESSIIRSLLDPVIQLDELALYDLDTGTSTASESTKTKGQIKDTQTSKDLGTNYPFIEINNYVFNINEIESFEIDYSGFLPIINLSVGVVGKVFGSEAMPKDGDRMAVFIRAKDDTFKPIRNDYRITSVRASGANHEGMNAMYYLTGELFIPHLYDEVVKSYKGTSYEVLMQVAKDLGLGFSSNDTETQDSQVWINPRGDYYNFIRDVAEHSWKDQESFFNVFIDIYYHLNFVNVNNQFSEDTAVDLQLLINLKMTDSVGGQTNADRLKDGRGTVPKVLTNYVELKGSPAYIHHFNIENASNFISDKYGYKTYSQFFDQASEEYWSIWVEPLNTKGAGENKIILKGRTTKPGSKKETFWKTQNRHKWEGILYAAPEGNSHDRYNYAKIWNERNLSELNKMKLRVELDRGNFNIYRGERLPILLLSTSDLQYQNIAAPPEQGQNTPAHPQPILDKFNSGYYMVDGMLFTYSPQGKTNSGDFPEPVTGRMPPGFTHTVILTRREWPTPI